MKTMIFTWIGRLMVMSFVFGMCGMGLVNGQPHKSTSLGLVCQLTKDCDGGCVYGKVVGEVTCQNCIGISNDALWRNPCPNCGRSRKVLDLLNCQKCQGSGILSFGPRFQVADADFPEEMKWDEAMNACRSLGGGWRLPTKEELGGMYALLTRKGKGNFQKNSFYWSRSQDDSGTAWGVFVDSGIVVYDDKSSDGRVRAVRDLP